MASVVDPFGLRDAAPEATAVIDGDRTVSYAELVALVAAAARDIGAAPAGLMVLGIDIALEPIVSYLAALSAGRTVLLVDPATSQDVVSTLMERYRPALVRGVAAAADVDPSGSPRTDLLPSGPTVLLGTSGSTGSPKVVRLPYVAVDANASSIAAALQLGPTERAALSLPLFYSYGLSVLNSHLRVGATVVAARDAVTSRPFWTTFDGAGCTSFAGVPYTYAMLQRMRIRPADHPSLRTMTQAGGKLDVDTRRHFHAAMSEVGGRFIVMYGQTEATARMSVLPHECFHDHEASVGWAIPGGRFEIVDPDGRPCDVGVEGDVVYEGPNVMLGYAESLADLVATDQLGGRLDTGDRGRLAADGSLWLTGREKRICKIFGTRVSLDDVETALRGLGLIGAAVAGDDRLVVVVEGEVDRADLTRTISNLLRVHRSGVSVEVVPSLPLLPNGKTDLAGLTSRFA